MMNELETYKITAYIMIAIQVGIGLAMLFGIKGIIDICSQTLEELKKQNKEDE